MVAWQERFAPKIAHLKSRIALCTMEDVVVNNGDMELRRKEVAWLWARITASPIVMSDLSPYGYPVKENFDRQTHRVMIRRQTYLDITSAAWVYEQRRITPPRWFKVLGFADIQQWIFLTVHLQERSELAQPPMSSLDPRPSKVSL